MAADPANAQLAKDLEWICGAYDEMEETFHWPDIAAQWCPTMNGRLGPSEVLATSGREAWWKGECGHTWKAKVRDCTCAKGPSCLYCSGRRKPERPIRLD